MKTSGFDKTLSTLSEVIGATIPDCIDIDTVYQRVLTQSVYVQPGDVVICGKWYLEKNTVSDALKKGAVAVFCSQEIKTYFPNDNVISVADPLECVRLYEEWCVKSCRAKRIAITGSVGKTTTTGLINTVIANSFHTLTHHSMANSHGAILRNAQRLEPSHEYWVQEVGGVQPGYIESSARFLCPDIVVLTNIGESHLNLYGTKENILKDKGSLEKYAQPDGVVIINYDDDILRNAKFSHRVITCSLYNKAADYYAENIRLDVDGTHFTAVSSEGKYDVHLNLYGNYNAYNALFAVAVGREAKVPMKKIVELLEKYSPNGMRQNLINVGGYTIFLDSFNAEPKTVLGSAVTLAQMPRKENGRKIFVTGHIDKLGTESPQMHAALGHELSRLDDIDFVILFAGDSQFTYQAMVEDGFKNVIHMSKREELDDWLRKNLNRSDIVFFKSGQFEAALTKTVDHVFGTAFQNEQQFNEGTVVEKDGYKFRIRQDKIAEIIGYTGKNKELVIPTAYKDNTVIRIAPNAFSRNKEITSVIIPDTVEHIGDAAFYICPKLEYVKLPSRLLYIDNNAFNYCTSLKQVEIPERTIHIGRRAFYDCKSLEKICIPPRVGFLGGEVFGLDSRPGKVTLRVACQPNSYAERYALENQFLTEAYAKSETANDTISICSSDLSPRPKDSKRIERVMLEKQKKTEACNRIFELVKAEIGCNEAPLTNAEIEQIRETWGELFERGMISPRWAALYKDKTGEFRPDYVGNDFHIYYAEDLLVDRTYIRGLCDKNIMPLVTPLIKHPLTIIRKLNGIYVDENFEHISEEDAVALLYKRRNAGAVIKQCRSSGGKGVDFVSSSTTEDEIRFALNHTPYVTVQEVVKQHPDMEKMNSSSVNTIRIMTILINGEAVAVSAVVRIGSAGSKVDNFHSGGVSCGINEDGTLKDFACDVTGKRQYIHSSGFVYAGAKIPSFDKACSIVKKLHYILPVFGIISWDICIDEYGEPVLLEYNIGGGITVHQLSNGPLYGKYRQDIANEVMGKYSEKCAVLDYSYIWSADGVTITEGSKEAYKIDFPEHIDNKPLLGIEREAYQDSVNLKEIIVRANLRSVGFAAFYRCKKLEKVEFLGTVTEIERSAFNSCSALKTFVVPEGTKIIGKYSFANNALLNEVTIPESVYKIAPDAFYRSPNVKIICKKGSYAEAFAKNENIPYISQ